MNLPNNYNISCIDKIKLNSILVKSDDNVSIYKHNITNGYILIKIYLNMNYDVLRYIVCDSYDVVGHALWTISTPEELYNKYFLCNTVHFTILSMRKYGERKLVKPSILNGIEQSFSVEFCEKCKCPIYLTQDSIYIKHRDFFSEMWRPPKEDIGKPLSYLMQKYFSKVVSEKFVYADCWGGTVLRNEAWICYENIVPYILVNNIISSSRYMKNLLFDTLGIDDNLCYTVWEWFFERIAQNVKDTRN